MRCAQSGANVTLLEKTAPAAGATSKSLAWLNPFMDDDHYMRVRLDALQRWQSLDEPLGIGVTWGGYIGFSDKADDRGRMSVQSQHLAAAGHPTRSLDIDALKQMSPAIDPARCWKRLGPTWVGMSTQYTPRGASSPPRRPQERGSCIHAP